MHTQSYLTLCNPLDCSPTGSSVLGTFQTRILEWVAISYSRRSFLTQRLNPCLLCLLHCRQILTAGPPKKPWKSHGFCSVIKSCLIFVTHELQNARLLFPPLSPRVCSNSCPLSWWYHPTTSSSVVPFSSCHQSFPASRSFPMSQLFVSGGQSIGASASVLPMNIQDLFHLGLAGFISLLSRGLSRAFSSTKFKRIIG